MRTIDDIISSVYGARSGAAEALGTVPSAIANWVALGYVPGDRAIAILFEAKSRGVTLDFEDIPLKPARARKSDLAGVPRP